MTFTLMGRDPKTCEIGLAVSTSAPAVGKRVPHLRDGIGFVATQGKTNVRYGTIGLRLMEIGFSPYDALEILLRQDNNRQYRQVLFSNFSGDWAVHTGELTEPWQGHILKPFCVAMGNTLPGKQVLEGMTESFEKTSGELARRLVAGLKEGQDAGGEREGKCSAALLVWSPHRFKPYGTTVDLRVDFDPNPVYKLQEILNAYLVWEEKKLKEINQVIYGFEKLTD